MTPKISIIIVNYTSGEFLMNCLCSIKQSVTCNHEVIVVDNDSLDDSFNRCKTIFRLKNYRFVEAGGNIGFAKGNNLGVNYASGDIFHFLNPDTILYPTINADYMTAMSSPNNSYINKLINPDGTIANKSHLLPSLKYYLKAIFGKKWNWYIGASVIISRENFERIGRWNEQYFMYAEDLDLFYKMAQNDILSVELTSQITHIGGGCSSNVWNDKEKSKKKNDAYRLFFKINNIRWQYPIIRILSSSRFLVHKIRHKIFER